MSASSGLDWPWSSREGSGTKRDFTRRERPTVDFSMWRSEVLSSHVRILVYATNVKMHMNEGLVSVILLKKLILLFSKDALH